MSNHLQLCAGRQRKPGWTRLDANPRVQPDIVATIPPLPEEVRAQRWEAVELIHGIEHFYLWEAKALLREIHSVLAPGGVLILEQPNLEYAAKVLTGQITPPRGRPGQFDMWGIYGDPTHRDPLFCHRWGYTPATLPALLRDCGFETDQITVLPARSHFPIRDFRVEARKAA